MSHMSHIRVIYIYIEFHTIRVIDESYPVSVDARLHFGEVQECLDCDLKDLAVCSDEWGQTGFADLIFIQKHPTLL